MFKYIRLQDISGFFRHYFVKRFCGDIYAANLGTYSKTLKGRTEAEKQNKK